MIKAESIKPQIDYSRYYLKWHSDTPEHVQGMQKFYQKLLMPYLPEDRSSCILDIGCGMGFTLLALKELGYSEIEGIEVDKKQAESCQKKKLSVFQVEDSAEYLCLCPNKYDLIIILDVLEHILHGEQIDFVNAIGIALKPNGKLICTVPNANSTLASRWRYNDWTHHISFTEHSLDFLLFNAGFKDINVFETEFFEKPNLSPLSKVILTKRYWKIQLHWWLFRWVRFSHRLTMIAELGWEQGKVTPLSLNILATAIKP